MVFVVVGTLLLLTAILLVLTSGISDKRAILFCVVLGIAFGFVVKGTRDRGIKMGVDQALKIMQIQNAAPR